MTERMIAVVAMSLAIAFLAGVKFGLAIGVILAKVTAKNNPGGKQ